jgi:Calcineurin-like phosphoesterase
MLLVPLLALFALVATTEEQAEAANIAVEGESFDPPASGTNLITGTGYSGGAALKFTQDVTASHTVNCSTPCDVVLMASGGQSGGQASFSVNGSLPQALNSTTTKPYTFHLAGGATTIDVKAGGTGTGHNAILDVVTYPASDGGTDTTPPDTIITSPPSGSVIGTSVNFTFREEPDELGPTFFQCKLIGRDSTRTDCTSSQSPQSLMYDNLTVGTQYTFKVWATDAAGNIDPTPATFTFTPSDGTPPPTGGTARLIGAGDIARTGVGDVATGNLIEAILDLDTDARVFTAGDNAYPNGTASDFQNKYVPAWGSFKDSTSPSPGNHDYVTNGASAYKAYFGNLAGIRTVTPTTYYAYTLGAWRVYALDSNISMAVGSPQYTFVQEDMAKPGGPLCELAYWHHPAVSTGEHGNQARAKPIFQLFDTLGGDLILNGHDHNYERFERIDYTGTASANGVVEIVVGTGGTGFRTFARPALQTTEVRNDDTYGIVDINLDSTSYTGTFKRVPDSVPGSGTFTDSFSGTCGTS